MRITLRRLLCLLLILPMFLGCHPTTQVTGDPLVLPATQPGRLLYPHVQGPVSARSTYLPNQPATVTYAEGTDFTVDREAGTFVRTAESRIPDFTKNILYNKPNFDHSKFPGYGNLPFTIYVDYATTESPIRVVTPRAPTPELVKTSAKLRAGQTVKILAYGDSITAGGDASSTDLQYPALFAADLQKKFPRAKIVFENVATGGDTTRQGIARLQEKVLSKNPDLVLVAFGMNDHNQPNVGGVPLPEFRSNLEQIVRAIEHQTSAECILLSCFPPNPEWTFGTHNMAQYSAATRDAAKNTNSAFVDVYALFEQVLARKDPSSLLANNINHPNDFGHHLYLLALQSLKF